MLPHDTPERNLTSLQGIKVTDLHFDYRISARVVYAEWDTAADITPYCPRCDENLPDLEAQGWYTRKLKDRPVGGTPLYIVLRCHRHKCLHCGQTFGTQHPDVKDNSTLTHGLIAHLRNRSMSEDTHTRIAERTGVHESTVRKYFRQEWEYQKSGNKREIVEALGVDGVHVGGEGASTLIASLDEEGGSVIEVLPNADSAALKAFLEEEIAYSGDVLPVVVDMDAGYSKALKECRVPTVPVINRYHLAKRGNLALGKAKSDLLDTKGLEDDWEQRKEALRNGSSPVQRSVYDEPGLENRIDKMEAAWKMRWQYQKILVKDCSREEAKRDFQAWKKRLPDSVRKYFGELVINTVENWSEEVFNYHEYPYTNAFVEGKNNVAKKLRRKGAGYNHDTIRAKLIIGQDPRAETKPL